VAAAALVVLGPSLLRLWVGNAVDPPFLLLLGLGLWKVVDAGGTALHMLLNGAHVIRAQVVIGLTMASVAIALKIVLVGKFGAPGVVWGTLIAYSVCSIIPSLLIVQRILQRRRMP
jgi:hypothetical protein